MEFYDAYWFINNHPALTDGVMDHVPIDFTVMKVDPETGRIHDDLSRNTQTEIWLESGPYEDGAYLHDPNLDCGEETFEKAIITLAEKVKEHYGDYRKVG